MSLSNALLRADGRYRQAARTGQRDRSAPVVPQADDRPYAGIILLLIGGAMGLIGLGSTALLIVGLFAP